MRKIILIVSMSLLTLSITACSDDKNKPDSGIIDATETCKTYFAEIDLLVEKASKNTKTKEQLDMMKAQLEEGKKQVASLSKEQQDKACQDALDAMNKLKSELDH